MTLSWVLVLKCDCGEYFLIANKVLFEGHETIQNNLIVGGMELYLIYQSSPQHMTGFSECN